MAGLLLLAYSPCLRGGLLWDDEAHITRPDLRPASGLVRIWTHLDATQQYYPVLHSAFWLEHRLWGDATLGYHLLNVVLHGINACLFAVILSALARRRVPGAVFPSGTEWLAALLFAVHPVCVESVAWISEQKNTLSLTFYLLAARAYIGFCERRTVVSYGAAFLLFCAALGTKSVTATLPAALLLVAAWTKGRLSWRSDVVPLLPWFAAAVAAGLLTSWVERHVIGAQGGEFDMTASERILLAGRVIWFYLGKLLWPANLVFIYPRWNALADGAHSWVFPAAAAGTTVILWSFRRRLGGALAGWLFFVGSLFPALGFFNVFPFLYSYVADHFQYLASLGVFATGSAGIVAMLAKLHERRRWWGRLACGALIGGLAFMSRLQSRTYRDSETLYRTTIARNPECWMAENNLAAALAQSGRNEEALAHYHRALEIRPAYPEAHNNLGNLLASLPGHAPEALAQYGEALLLRPDFAEAHTDLANLLAGIAGKEADATAHYREALRLKPADATAHYDLAGEFARTPGRESEAIGEYKEALRLSPGSAEAHSNLGVVLSRSGRFPEAVAEFAEALQLNPGFAPAHVNMANVLANMPGRLAEAFDHYEAALRINPRLVQVHDNLATLYLGQGRLSEAAQHCMLALEISPGDAIAARILSQTGRAESARTGGPPRE